MPAPSKESVLRSMRRLYRQYNRMCCRRNVFWDLTLEQFQKITSSPCYYCGKEPSQKSRSYTYNGIDRLDGKKGYVPTNVAPCCRDCNWLKGNRLTQAEMKVVAEALKKFRQRPI